MNFRDVLYGIAAAGVVGLIVLFLFFVIGLVSQ
jgi:hypothetical protein